MYSLVRWIKYLILHNTYRCSKGEGAGLLCDIKSQDLSSFLHVHTPPPHIWTLDLFIRGPVNATEKIQPSSYFGALSLSYTMPYLSCQVFIYTWVSWSMRHIDIVQTLNGEKDVIFLGQAGFESSRQAASITNWSIIAPRPSIGIGKYYQYDERDIIYVFSKICHNRYPISHSIQYSIQFIQCTRYNIIGI